MRRIFLLMLLMLLMGFSSRAMAQTHSVSVEYDKEAFAQFWMWNGDNAIGKAGDALQNLQVENGSNIFIDAVRLMNGYELAEVLANGNKCKVNSTGTYISIGKITADTQVKIVTQRTGGGEATEKFPVTLTLQGEMPAGYFFSVYENVPGAGLKKFTSGESVEKGTSMKLSWGPEIGVENTHDAQITINGKPLSKDIIAAKNYMFEVNEATEVVYSFVSKAPVVKEYDMNIRVEGQGGTFSLLEDMNYLATDATEFSQKFEAGKTLQLLISADDNYTIDVVNVDGESKAVDGGVLVLTTAEAACNIVITFRKLSNKCTLNIKVEGEGGQFTLYPTDTWMPVGDLTTYTEECTPGKGFQVLIENYEGYEIGGATINGVEQELTGGTVLDFTVNEPEVNVVIRFTKLATYPFHVKVDGEGGTFDVVKSGSAVVTNSTDFTTEFIADEQVYVFLNVDQGYEVDKAMVDGVETEVTGEQIMLIMPAAACNVVITFKKVGGDVDPNKAHLKVNVVGQGSVRLDLVNLFQSVKKTYADAITSEAPFDQVIDKTCMTGSIMDREQLQFTYYPAAGYKISSVVINGYEQVCENGVTPFYFDEDKEATVTFVEDGAVEPTPTYTVNWNVTGEGEVNAYIDGGAYLSKGESVDEGTKVIFTPTAFPGSVVESLNINGRDLQLNAEGNLEWIVNEDVMLNVTFAKEQFGGLDFTVATEGEGVFDLKTSVEGEMEDIALDAKEFNGTVEEGTTVYMFIRAAEGWNIKSVMENNQDVTANLSETGFGNEQRLVLQNVSESKNIKVVFEEAAPVEKYTVRMTLENEHGVFDVRDGDYQLVGENATSFESTVDAGASFAFFIHPDEGWEVAYVMKNGTDKAVFYDGEVAGEKIVMIQDVNQDVNFVVTFKEKKEKHNLTVTVKDGFGGVFDIVDEEGNDIIIGQSNYSGLMEHGRNFAIKVMPDDGWKVKSVILNGTTDVTANLAQGAGSTASKLFVFGFAEDATYEITFAEAVGIDENLAELVCYDAVAETLRTPEEAAVELYSVTGVKVAAAQGNLNMSAMNNGIYLAKVALAGKTVVVKIVK